GVNVICQKPMAPDLETAEDMVRTCQDAGVRFLVHENWRWQYPLRRLKEVLDSGTLGKPFRGRIVFSTSFPVFDNQPFLRELEQFILTDIGSHILDTARFLFGEASRLYCRTRRVNQAIRGEDVATVVMDMGDDVTVICEMSYASRLEHERFPNTYVTVECEKGSVELGPDYWIRVTTEDGTFSKRHAPPRYAWADPEYDVVHSSIVPCNAHLLHALRIGQRAETEGDDNIKTVRLVFGAYESAATGKPYVPPPEA
ncbi:MAG: Gfo/Idh/MocA family protein, partial [Armatimonadota bacterium]